MKNIFLPFVYVIACLTIVIFLNSDLNAQRLQRAQRLTLPTPPIAVQEEDADADEAKEQDEDEAAQEEEDVIEVPAAKKTELPGEQEIRFELWDGTIVAGNINIEYITVETQFGKLDVPVKNIIRMQPGLDSFPQMNEKLNLLVEQLGDRDFQVRESAHRELVVMGPMIRTELGGFEDGGSAERKKHLEKIAEQIDEMMDEEDDEIETESELVRGDTIQTLDFTIVGKILQPEFRLSSKYGDLQISLADIKSGDRTWMETSQSIVKTVNVEGNSFFQSTPVSTKIRVSKGDRIKIRASGNVSWASWGNISSTPDGITNQGNWREFTCGTLVARVGSGDNYTKIGSKNEFVAKADGILFLGIAMRDNYANQAGYQWPGTYKARVTVTPGASE